MKKDTTEAAPDGFAEFNGHACCLLQLCCPPAEQLAALAAEMSKGLHVEETEAKRYAEWVMQRFDLAPAGTLTAFKHAIKHAIKHAQ